jgi:hypothetical protein
MKMMNLAVALTTLTMLASCEKDLVTYQNGDVKVVVEAGDAWLHDFPLFMGIKKKNPPQIAIWTEDSNGRYLSTLYVTHRIATGSWVGAKERPSALPVWSYARGAESVDASSGATPKGSFDVRARPLGNLRRFTVKVEINHSTDWNDNYPKNAAEGTPGWSGGEGGSGQPALVYAVSVDLDSPRKTYTAALVGHSSPDGSDGEIRPDTSTLTTALNIAKSITVNIE